ncbi:unnamed protein product [Clonostachys rosea]|uniref:Stc1 domain-containing protein n=1 Tax=Bionectria ochroleuca TaxID=29856 RepID=A0ABY6TP03_BIOOC|nr:unnamed protein product [Clonostachys rosea]
MGRQKQNRHKERQQPQGVDLMAALFGTPTRESIRRQEQQQFYDSDEYLESSESDEESSTDDDSLAWSEDTESDEESDGPKTDRLAERSSSKKKSRSRSATRPKSTEKLKTKMISPGKSSRSSKDRASVSPKPKKNTSAPTVRRSSSTKRKHRKRKKDDSSPSGKTSSHHLLQGQPAASSRVTPPPRIPYPVSQAVPGYPSVYTTTPFPVFQPVQGFQPLHTTQIAPETQNILAPLSQPPPIFAQPTQHQTAPILTYHQAPLGPVGIPACSSTHTIAQKLSSLQSEIDRKEKEVAARPHDVVMNYQLHTLRHEVNKTLNEAMTSSPQATCSPCSHKHSTASFEGEDGPSNFSTPVKSKTSRARTKLNRHGKEHTESEKLCSEAVLMGQRAESPEPSVKYHVCFGCGSVRSAKYHDSHPVDPGQGPIRNLCSRCRDAVTERGVIGSRHICFGCGIVRSKRFHKDHPVKKGEALLPNYCATCVSEMRTSDTAVDCSVVGPRGHIMVSNEIGSASKNYPYRSRQEMTSSTKGKAIESTTFSKESKRKSPREHRVREGSKPKEKLAHPKANVSEASNTTSTGRKMKYSPPRVEDLTSNLSAEQKMFRQGTERALCPDSIDDSLRSRAGGYSYDGPGNRPFSGLKPAYGAPRRDIPEDEQVLNSTNRSSFKDSLNCNSWGNLNPNPKAPEDGSSFPGSTAGGFESHSSPTSAASPATYESSSQQYQSPQTEHILPKTTGGAFSADAGFDPTAWNFSATPSWATKETPKPESQNPSPNRDFRPDDQFRMKEPSDRDYHKPEKANGPPRTPQFPRSPFLREPSDFGPGLGDQPSPPYSTNTPGGHHFPETAQEEPMHPREGKRSYNWYYGSVPGPDSKPKSKPKPNHFYFDAYNSQNCGDPGAWTKADEDNYAKYEFPKFPVEEILDSDVESDMALMMPITR